MPRARQHHQQDHKRKRKRETRSVYDHKREIIRLQEQEKIRCHETKAMRPQKQDNTTK